MSVETPKVAAAEDVVMADVDMVNIEIDGIPMQAPKGSMIIEASDKAGIDIPRFCYHPKLSIAANCRMCLVDVEKAPKPLPACATPVMDGMKVYTQSRRAMDAQHGVMEFLLINHPLDCPICDQGGECELQDLAMGYGRSVSRFTERKRVVKDKNVGPLVQTDMTRCIHCTRCVRFLEEIAGTAEMGGSGRGDRLEIGTCIETSIDSELSGNIIDLCPVGALTNKPFRFAARAWELVAKPSIAAHDGVGSHLFHHCRRRRILRSVPRENEAGNEAWLADRDRYSHLGLDAADRVLSPQIKKDGEWQNVSWDEAVGESTAILRDSQDEQGKAKLNVLMSPSAATEEHFLAQRLARSLGGNIDHRLREQDNSDDAALPVSPVFGMKIAAMESATAVLLVGSNPRHEAPILGHRLRKAGQNGALISAINPVAWSFVFDTAENIVVAPQQMASELAAVAAAVRKASGKDAPASILAALDGANPDARHEAIANQLLDAGDSLVLLGQFAMSHMDAAWLRQLSAYIAESSSSALNILPHGGNPVGAWMAGAVPHRGPGGAAVEAGLNVAEMLAQPDSTWLLWGFEPDFDLDNPARAMATLASAQKVIAVAEFATDSLRDVADVILPLAPLAESEGSLVNMDGSVLHYAPAVAASGEARPGWKILRRLGGELGLEGEGFKQINLDELQAQMNEEIASAAWEASDCRLTVSADRGGLFRIGELPMYSVDGLCRRATALQQTVHADSGFVGLHPGDAARLGLVDGGKARVKQEENHVELEVRVSDRVPQGAAWVRSATCATAALGSAVAPIRVEVA
jgi:NADH-quinone oxidoreductase subunit G